MVKFVINCLLNIQTQPKFKYAQFQPILFLKLLFNVKLIYSIQVLGPWLWGNRLFLFSGGAEEGTSGANAPRVHGIKKCLVSMSYCTKSGIASYNGKNA